MPPDVLWDSTVVVVVVVVVVMVVAVQQSTGSIGGPMGGGMISLSSLSASAAVTELPAGIQTSADVGHGAASRPPSMTATAIYMRQSRKGQIDLPLERPIANSLEQASDFFPSEGQLESTFLTLRKSGQARASGETRSGSFQAGQRAPDRRI